MADLAISGKKALATINKEFQAQFPYLMLQFFTKEECQKAQSGETVTPLDMSRRLASVRVTAPGTDEKELSIHGRTLVKNLEKNFLELYGICAQVCYEKDNNGYYTAGDEENMSLTQLNARLEQGGYTRNPC